MKRKLLPKLSFILSVLLLISCKSDDEYTAVSIDTEVDFVEVFQNASVEIDVLVNDTNVPNIGSLTAVSTSNAEITVIDAGSVNDPSDDRIKYIPNGAFVGDEIFTYTICDGSGNNCSNGTVNIKVLPVSPVNYDLASMPFPKLSDYNFYEGDMSNLDPVYGVLPYEPINTLFSDYAHKKRFIWMPSGVKAKFQEDHMPLDFPVGTLLVKNFYYDNVLPEDVTQLVETRVMIKTDSDWTFANYLWNDDQTEAYFDLNGSFKNIQWVENGQAREVNYRIPSEPECFTCHKFFTESTAIGLKPQNLNKAYLYEEGAENQLQKLINFGYLEGNLPSTIQTVGDWQDSTLSLKERVRSYTDINCAHCHSEWGHCDYRPLRFAYFQNGDDVNLGVCVDADTSIEGMDTLIIPQEPENSIIYFRVTSTAEEYRMPLMGRTINHDAGIQLIEEWINSLTVTCN